MKSAMKTKKAAALRWRVMKRRKIYWVALALCVPTIVFGRTFALTDHDCLRIAMIASDAPRLSWAGNPGKTCYNSSGLTFFNLEARKSAFLITFPIERIPKGMRVTSATLTMVCILNSHDGHKLQVRRIIGDWGDGVSYIYRRTVPEKVSWTKPGAAAIGADRAHRATATVTLKGMGEFQANVTQDVELWYSQSSPNNGWILTLETEGAVNFYSPICNPGHWRLDVSYEPR